MPGSKKFLILGQGEAKDKIWVTSRKQRGDIVATPGSTVTALGSFARQVLARLNLNNCATLSC